MKSNLSLKDEYLRQSALGADLGGAEQHPQSPTSIKPSRQRSPDEVWRLRQHVPTDTPVLTLAFLNLRGLWRRHTGLIVVITLLTLGVAAIGVSKMETYHTATSSVILDQRDTRSLENSPQQRNILPPLNPDGEVELLKSNNVALRVVQRLRLMEDPEFVPSPGQLSKLIATVRSIFPAKLAEDAVGDLQANSPSVSEASSEGITEREPYAKPEPLSGATATALRNLASQVEIRRLGLSDIIAIKASALHPDRAAQIANAYAESYLKEQIAPKLLGISRAERALSRQLEELDRELRRSEAQIGLRQIYQDTQLRLQTVSQQRYLVTADARIGSLALTTGSFSGGGLPLVKIFGMIGSALASIILAFGAAYVRDLHTRRVQTEEEIERTSGVPNLASIPLFRSFQCFRRVNLVDQIVYQPSNSYANEVRKLYFNLQLLMTKASSARSVLITSTDREEGKTTLALSLGRTAARAGTKTLIIDCDPESSGLSHLLDLDKHSGFADVLAGCCDERHILQDDPHSSCKIMASGNASDVAAEWLLQPSRVRAVLQRLELEFDLIILDAAPVEQSADSIILKTVSDLTVFVVRTGWSRPEAIQSSIHQLQRIDDAEIVTALNFATE